VLLEERPICPYNCHSSPEPELSSRFHNHLAGVEKYTGDRPRFLIDDVDNRLVAAKVVSIRFDGYGIM
jgi:hypothetical protein